MNTKQCIAVCDRLLRGEISAVETYSHALHKFAGEASSDLLERLRNDHRESCVILRDHLKSMGEEGSRSSGPWGDFVKAIEGAASLTGDKAALRVLEAGEVHGVDQYKEALDDAGVMDDLKETIRQKLLPRLEEHIVALQGLRKN